MSRSHDADPFFKYLSRNAWLYHYILPVQLRPVPASSNLQNEEITRLTSVMARYKRQILILQNRFSTHIPCIFKLAHFSSAFVARFVTANILCFCVTEYYIDCVPYSFICSPWLPSGQCCPSLRPGLPFTT